MANPSSWLLGQALPDELVILGLGFGLLKLALGISCLGMRCGLGLGPWASADWVLNPTFGLVGWATAVVVCYGGNGHLAVVLNRDE